MIFKNAIFFVFVIGFSFCFASESNRHRPALGHIREEKELISLVDRLIPQMQQAIKDCGLEEKQSALNNIKSDFETYKEEILPHLNDALNNSLDSQKICAAMIQLATSKYEGLTGAAFFCKKSANII